MSFRAVTTRLLSVAFALSFVGASCGQTSLAVMPGVVNDPGNLTLRRGIFSFARGQICREVQKRSIPLMLREEDPATGRFFPLSCAAQELASGNLFLQFGGYGYAWTNLTKRIGFDASAAVEYDHDFLMDGSTMYIYFRERSTSATTFTSRLVEQPPQPGTFGLPGGSPQGFLDTVGGAILKKEISRGFTVIRDADGSVDFGLGIVEKGKRPGSPYESADNGRLVLANERVEVHQGQRDHVGPFEVKGKGQALYLSVAVDGAPAVDVIVVHRGVGDAWLQHYTTAVGLGPPPAAPVLDEPVSSGMVWRRPLPLPAGQYYVVFDNTAAAGRTAPPTTAGDDRAALVSYAVEVGAAP
ncbi:hypothetical protein [Polyangium spumosum]|uniref:Uncharacterized protein n=1 Tax=Polyangium spumosum TaxID=889282 RepID=A0A6N7PKR6_9BACT|nr:hypothetical protein [Polyangium spumosum]MRG92653.1 hypothetical protein [Polyangium spumosum]